MKLLTKFLALMLICTTAMSITSCLGDSNDNDYSEYQITPEKYTLYLNEMAGNYTGKMYFYNDTISKVNKTDSVSVSVMIKGIGDSTITVLNFPPKCLARLVKNKEAKEALEHAESMPITAKFYLYQKDKEINNAYYGVYPSDLIYNLNYKDGNHKVRFTFAQVYRNSGEYYFNRTAFEMRLYRIYVDDIEDRTLTFSSDINSILQISVQKY